MRHSTVFAGLIFLQTVLVAVMLLHSHSSKRATSTALREQATIVKSVGITDLCLFTEARYTRHPAMADRFSAFQDHPMALEHFPSGSLVNPPVMRFHERNP